MKINAAIQLLPLKGKEDKIVLIDKAIKLIQDSGLPYKVCPFETVVEGPPDEVFTLIRSIQDTTLTSGCDELLINIKIHAANRDLQIGDKLEKYEKAAP
jgi:uncharacterized protein YqgV (UPF0045/DUF77 family)